jgi:hypothetical protein
VKIQNEKKIIIRNKILYTNLLPSIARLLPDELDDDTTIEATVLNTHNNIIIQLDYYKIYQQKKKSTIN